MSKKYILFILFALFPCLASSKGSLRAADRIIPATPVTTAPGTSASGPQYAPSAEQPGQTFESSPLQFPETTRRPRSETAASQPRTLPSILSVLLYAFAICSVFILVLWAMKKYVPGHKRLFSHPAMEVLGRSHLDQRSYLSLVRVGRRIIVVGVSQEGLSSLSEITDGEEITEILEVARPKAEMGLNLFQKLFQRHVLDVDSAGKKGEIENKAKALREEIASLRNRIDGDGFARPLERLDRIG